MARGQQRDDQGQFKGKQQGKQGQQGRNQQRGRMKEQDDE